jgi:hypothetical protein
MSRLIDLLQKTGQAATQPMGFRSIRETEYAPKIPIIASLDTEAVKTPADYLEGASGALFQWKNSIPTTVKIKELVANLPDMPWGASIENNDEKAAADLIDAGCDFLIIPSAGPVSAAPDNEDTGRILQVESGLNDTTLRAINDLPVDAAFVSDIQTKGEPLTWNNLMSIKRMTGLLSIPLMVPLTIKTSESELRALHEAGVEGAVVEIDAGKPDGIKELRGLIDKLPPPAKRKHRKNQAILPDIGGMSEEESPDEDDEEYE